MNIGKKIFLALFGLSFFLMATLTATNLYSLIEIKNDIGEAQNAHAEDLISTNIEVMEASNQDMVTAIAQNYSDSIESKFISIRNQVLTVKNYLNGVYKSGAQTVSRFPDDMYYLQPGVSAESVEEELQVIKSVRDVIASIVESNPDIAVYYVTQSGMLLADRYVDYSTGSNIDRRTRDWYVGAASTLDIFWTPIYTDALSGELTITCSAPVIAEDGTLLGVIGSDILIGALINDVLNANSQVIEYTFLIDNDGKDFVGSISGKNLSDFIPDESRKNVLIERMNSLTKNTGTTNVYEDGQVMVGYAHIPVTGWNIGVIINYERIIAPSQSIEKAIISSTDEFHAYLADKIRNAIIVSTVITLVMFISIFLVSRRITNSITNPIGLLTKGVNEISGGNLDYSINLQSGDEIEHLAGAFNTMTVRLREYIENLAKVTADRERIAAELNVATQIQADMLPNIFPAFPEREEFEIYATMQPAKEVGGDFYDFFLVDDDHLGVVIADVSGKSVPAALFMVIAKTLINNRARTKEEPKDVFINVNNQLCEGNETAMFVTAWMGVIEISTGKMTYVNAGHNPPLLKKAGGEYEYLVNKKSFVLAGMRGFKYKQFELQLNSGDMLFLYTDGVTEANNLENELYGEERLKNILNSMPNVSLVEFLPKVKADIDKFANGADQFDDITMLSVKLN